MDFNGKTYRKKPINLNGNNFNHCKFYECEMIFNGVGSVGLTNSEFRGCRWTFQGPAADTVAFMKALYSMGGDARKLIIATFEQIAPDVKVSH